MRPQAAAGCHQGRAVRSAVTNSSRSRPARHPVPSLRLLIVLLAAAALAGSAAATTKWTFFIYMLADNDLECFAIDDMAVSCARTLLVWWEAVDGNVPHAALAPRPAQCRACAHACHAACAILARAMQTMLHEHMPHAARAWRPQELMLGMAREPSACLSPGCGAPCPDGHAAVRQAACAGGKSELRCCPAAPYPDVFVWVDRGSQPCFVDDAQMRGLDTSLLTSSWTNVRELQLLPGARV